MGRAIYPVEIARSAAQQARHVAPVGNGYLKDLIAEHYGQSFANNQDHETRHHRRDWAHWLKARVRRSCRAISHTCSCLFVFRRPVHKFPDSNRDQCCKNGNERNVSLTHRYARMSHCRSRTNSRERFASTVLQLPTSSGPDRSIVCSDLIADRLLCRYLPNRKWRPSHGMPDGIRRAVHAMERSQSKDIANGKIACVSVQHILHRLVCYR
jgi:hypothetical protein